MSIIPLNRGNFITNRVRMNPRRHFISSSNGAVTGALKVIVNRSATQKDNIDMREGLTGEDAPQKFTENTFEGRRIGIWSGKLAPAGTGEMFADRAIDESTGQGYNFELNIGLLLDGADPFEAPAYTHPPELWKREYVQLNLNMTHEGYSDLPMHPRNNAELLIRCLHPGNDSFSTGSRALQMCERLLLPYYSVNNSRMGSKYTNYSCFNFFRVDEDVDLRSAVIYSAKDEKYTFDDSFTFEFYVKTQPTTGSNCIMHLPGNYAISVISGSELNEKGFPSRYKLLLQLEEDSASPIYSPDSIGSSGHSNTKYYYSYESLFPNHWHHCAVRWDNVTKQLDFLIDNENAGKFSYTKSTTTQDPKALILGAFWNKDDGSVSELEYFFNQNNDQGVGKLYSGNTHPVDRFVSTADLEVHEIRLWNKRRSKAQVLTGSILGLTSSATILSSSGLSMYIPVLYEPQSPENKYALITGDVNITTASVGSISPYLSQSSELFGSTPSTHIASFPSTTNTNHSNIGGFCNVNIQSYAKEWIHSNYPYMHNMSESLKTWESTSQLTSSWQEISTHEKRNCLILPCDNGKFAPGFKILSASKDSPFYDGRPQMINTKDIGDRNNFYDSRLFYLDECFKIVDSYQQDTQGSSTTQGPDSRYNDVKHGAEIAIVPAKSGSLPTINLPFSPMLSPGDDLSTAIDSTDFVSPIVSVISIPQLYYGDMIEPKSVIIKSFLYKTGSKSEIILRDDGNGSIYRAQAETPAAKWNTVGDIYYKEGLIFLRNPSLFAVGKNNVDLEFQGRNYTNVMEINVPCPKGMINSSSNPNFVSLAASESVIDKSSEFVYISTVYLHDENLNVVGKAKMAQPIIKRPESKYMFRLRVDF